MIRIAFASTDSDHVNTHFGAAERFVVFDVAPGMAEMVGVGEFRAAVMKGDNKDKSFPSGTKIVPGEEMRAKPAELEKPPEDKILAKLAFLSGCAAVYAASIGNSSIKRLMAANIQPIIVGNGHEIVDLLNEVSLALAVGGLSWVTRATTNQISDDRLDDRAAQGWTSGSSAQSVPLRHALITSIDDVDQTSLIN